MLRRAAAAVPLLLSVWAMDGKPFFAERTLHRVNGIKWLFTYAGAAYLVFGMDWEAGGARMRSALTDAPDADGWLATGNVFALPNRWARAQRDRFWAVPAAASPSPPSTVAAAAEQS